MGRLNPGCIEATCSNLQGIFDRKDFLSVFGGGAVSSSGGFTLSFTEPDDEQRHVC